MQTQSSELNFEGQNLYIGIDVHLKGWTVSILTEKLSHKTFTQPPSAEELLKYLRHNFPGGTYHSVYEAGFSGFWTHYKLREMGVNNIVINAADVPTSQKEHVLKDDPTDSRKLARSLRSGDLNPIYVPDFSTLQERSFVRVRATLVKDAGRYKSRIKALLYFYGVPYPKEYERSGTHWSKRFMKWLMEGVVLENYAMERTDLNIDSGYQALHILVQEAQHLRELILETTRKIRSMSRVEKYAQNIKLLETVPGVGLITAMTFLTEIENINRFQNTDHFASYIGLVPSRHSSGARENNGEMTFRGHDHLCKALIESAWIAVRWDPALTKSFYENVKRMDPNQAIIKIARKLLNRIYLVLKNKEEYVKCVVK